MMAVMFTSGADLLVINPTLPEMAADLGVSVELASTWVSAYALATGSFALLFGPISDRLGRRRILLAGLATLTSGVMACALATDFWTLVAARFVAGAGAGMLVTSTTSYVGDHFDDGTRAIAMGWVMSGFFLSLILAVPIGAWLAHSLGWANMFKALAGVSGLTFLLVLTTVGDPRYERRSTRLSLGSALSGYGRLLMSGPAFGVLLFSASIGMSMTMFSVYTAPWLEEAYGFTTLDRGLMYGVGGPAILIGGPLSGKLANRLGRLRLVSIGTCSMALMLLMMPLTPEASHVLASLFPDVGGPSWGTVPVLWVAPTALVFFLAICSGTTRSGPYMTLALEVVEPDQRGAMSALRNAFNHGGGTLGATLGALVWAHAPYRYPAVCVASAAATLGGLVLLRHLMGPVARAAAEEGEAHPPSVDVAPVVASDVRSRPELPPAR